MKANAVLPLVLIGVAAASATVRVFVTSSDEPYGLDARSFSCYPTWPYPAGYDCDHFQVTNFPPVDYPSGSCGNGTRLVCPGACSEPFVGGYIWLQFQNEPLEAKINGLAIGIHECGTTTPATCVYPTYYFLNNTSSGGYKRWDGFATPPYFPEFHGNPWTGIAISAHGIVNKASDEWCNLYDGAMRTALLGAIICNAEGAGHPKDLSVNIENISYQSPPNPYVQGGYLSLFDRGDLNCDGTIDFGDINPFVLILTDPAAWQETHPDCPFLTGDINGDGAVDFADINPFVALLIGQ